MALADRLRHTVVIERFADAGTEDDYGQSELDWTQLASVRAWVQPMSRRDQQQLSGVGPVVSTHRVFLAPTDITPVDRLKHGAAIYSIDEVLDPAGKGHHLELLCHEVGA